MKLQEAKEAFYDSTEKLSENIRKLVLAGVAIIWIFKVADKTAAGIIFSPALLPPLAAFVLSLVLDIGQYLYQGTAWWLYYRRMHKKGIGDDDEISPSGSLNLITFVLFYMKVFCCAFGFYRLLGYIWGAMHPAT
jgi:hypothetical protein